jgi:hypothetical protein
MAGSQDMMIIVVMMMMMSSVFSVLAGGALFFTLPQEGDECEGKDDNGNYVIDEDLECVLDYCDSGYSISSSGKKCIVDEIDTDSDGDDDPPTDYVYEFIVKEQSAHTDKFNIHITDIEADGLRVTSEQLTIHEEPEWAKCNSDAGNYECVDDVYGMIDPEPIAPIDSSDLTWSGWKDGQGEVGTKLLTITMPYKVDVFTFDYFRPKYVPGWTIKENGVEVLTTTKGANADVPQPSVVTYTIP